MSQEGLGEETAAGHQDKTGVTDPDVIDFGDAGASPPSPPLTVPERIAIQTHMLRIIVAGVTLVTFLVLNGLVLWGLYQALQFDFRMISAKTANYTRYINTEVILSILGATAVQLGAMMIAIAKFLFGKAE